MQGLAQQPFQVGKVTIWQTAEVKHFEKNLVHRAVVKKTEEEAFSPRGQPPSQGRMHRQRGVCHSKLSLEAWCRGQEAPLEFGTCSPAMVGPCVTSLSIKLVREFDLLLIPRT